MAIRKIKPKASTKVRRHVKRITGIVIKPGNRRKFLSQPVEVLYKTAAPGTGESDEIHIQGSRGSMITSRLRLSIQRLRETPGYVVKDVQIGELMDRAKPAEIKMDHIAITVDRDLRCSPEDVVRNVQNQLAPRFRFARVRFFAASSDLPGEPTGPGPGPRPPKK